MDNREPCQVCGRMLVPLKSGLTRRHVRTRGDEDLCAGTGYRQRRWDVGQHLRHHAGDVWLVVDDRGGRWGGYWLRCLAGREKDREFLAHGEYMHRHGWLPVNVSHAYGGSS